MSKFNLLRDSGGLNKTLELLSQDITAKTRDYVNAYKAANIYMYLSR